MGDPALRAILETGDLDVVGRLVDASNTTLLCRSTLDGATVECVYKPRRGERPLWDFPTGTLGFREVAAYEFAQLLGWDAIPLTVWRDGGPLGAGMCQLWIDTQEGAEAVDVVRRGKAQPGWIAVFDAEDQHGRDVSLVHRDEPALRRLAALDVAMNNADRKGGHILVDQSGAVRGIDHGICFNTEDKLRTVLWGFAGQMLEPELLADLQAGLERFDQQGEDVLGGLLTRAELDRTRERLAALIDAAAFPAPGTGWPALPWPPI